MQNGCLRSISTVIPRRMFIISLPLVFSLTRASGSSSRVSYCEHSSLSARVRSCVGYFVKNLCLCCCRYSSSEDSGHGVLIDKCVACSIRDEREYTLAKIDGLLSLYI